MPANHPTEHESDKNTNQARKDNGKQDDDAGLPGEHHLHMLGDIGAIPLVQGHGTGGVLLPSHDDLILLCHLQQSQPCSNCFIQVEMYHSFKNQSIV